MNAPTKRQSAEKAAADFLRATSKALGHSDINSSDKYLSFLEDDLGAAIMAI
jgi:hypothetical protein